MPKYIPLETKRKARELRSQGLPIAHIARRLDLSRNTVYKITGGPTRKRKRTGMTVIEHVPIEELCPLRHIKHPIIDPRNAPCLKKSQKKPSIDN